ncbi:MAG: SigB/SigF/SigG family RNA polymerase sigma factor [Clostridiaceae bacterium]|nr:SigB/SigF/SigG family RNA polymerase sigma factor [Clostridiaceae bacterium]
MQRKKSETISLRSDGTENDMELFHRYKEKRSISDRNAIVNKYLYLAEIIAKKFVNRGIEYDDIFQVASIALIKSVERYDPGRGVKFISFATPTIIGEIKRYFRDKGSTIRIPRRIYEDYKKINLAMEKLQAELGRPPRVDEIADYLNVSAEYVLEIIEARNAYNMKSFDQNAFADEDIELHETVGKEDEEFEKIENRDFLEKSMDKLSEIEKEFIRMRYYENKTQKVIAEKMGVSQMYVSRMERKVLNKLKLILS